MTPPAGPPLYFPGIILRVDDDLTNKLLYPLYIPKGPGQSNTLQLLQRILKIEDTDTVKMIHYSTGGAIRQATGQKTLQNLSGLGNYTVSPGKTAKVILIFTANTDNCRFRVWQTDGVDDVGTGSPIIKYEYTGSAFDNNDLMTVSPDWDTTPQTFAAGKFITIEVTTAGGSLNILSAAVIES